MVGLFILTAATMTFNGERLAILLLDQANGQ
jgi:hypothetical protein